MIYSPLVPEITAFLITHNLKRIFNCIYILSLQREILRDRINLMNWQIFVSTLRIGTAFRLRVFSHVWLKMSM